MYLEKNTTRITCNSRKLDNLHYTQIGNSTFYPRSGNADMTQGPIQWPDKSSFISKAAHQGA